MKNLIFLLLLGMISFTACQNDSPSTVDFSTLQKSMDADADVTQLRTLLYSHARILASIPVDELDGIFKQLHSCGLDAASNITDMKSCLPDTPSKDAFVTCQEQVQKYNEQYKVVELRFPEFAQLDHKKQAELLVPVDQESADEVLSDYLANRNK